MSPNVSAAIGNTDVSDALDTALNQLHAFGCELDNGLTNHAPMVAEALSHLGLDASIEHWVSGELGRCRPRPELVRPVKLNRWRDALGEPARFSDWATFFQSEIERLGWSEVLHLWVPRLAPGFVTAAAHGVIRVGHAARGLRARDTVERKLELADALASWTSEYTTLPIIDAQPQNLSPSQALAQVELVDPEHHARAGSISDAIACLSDNKHFAAYFSALGINDDRSELVLDIAATFARLFCQSSHDVLSAIVFTHAITAVAAVQNLAPHLEPDQHTQLLRHAFHCGCALHAVYSENKFVPPTHEPMPIGMSECIYDALAHGDEHVIKLTEVCVGFTLATGDAFFMTAAERARRLLPTRR